MRSRPKSGLRRMNGTLPNRLGRRNTRRHRYMRVKIIARPPVSKAGSLKFGRENLFTQFLDDPAMNIPHDIFAVMFDQPMALTGIFFEFSAQPRTHFVGGGGRRDVIIAAP